MSKQPIKIVILAAEIILIVILVVFNFRITDTIKEEIVYARVTSESEGGSQTVPKFSFASILSGDIFKSSSSSDIVSTPEPVQRKRDVYIIAAVGDSMVETMGGGLDYLSTAMREKYPDKTMVFYNYGIGAESLESALERFDKPYDNLGRTQETLAQLSPDILIVGSYSYNPPFPYDENKQVENLGKLLDKAKSVSGGVYLLVEIAPLQYGFGEGVGGVNWPKDKANEHSANILRLLKKSQGVAADHNVEIINVYEKSLVEGSEFGQKLFVSPHDNIHPSEDGQVLKAEVATDTIVLPW